MRNIFLLKTKFSKVKIQRYEWKDVSLDLGREAAVAFQQMATISTLGHHSTHSTIPKWWVLQQLEKVMEHCKSHITTKEKNQQMCPTLLALPNLTHPSSSASLVPRGWLIGMSRQPIWSDCAMQLVPPLSTNDWQGGPQKLEVPDWDLNISFTIFETRQWWGRWQGSWPDCILDSRWWIIWGGRVKMAMLPILRNVIWEWIDQLSCCHTSISNWMLLWENYFAKVSLAFSNLGNDIDDSADLEVNQRLDHFNIQQKIANQNRQLVALGRMVVVVGLNLLYYFLPYHTTSPCCDPIPHIIIVCTSQIVIISLSSSNGRDSNPAGVLMAKLLWKTGLNWLWLNSYTMLWPHSLQHPCLPKPSGQIPYFCLQWNSAGVLMVKLLWRLGLNWTQLNSSTMLWPHSL